MKRAPAWTEEEIETLLRNPDLSDEEMLGLLPRRSIGAIGVARAGLHAYHRGQSTTMLTKLMKARLEKGVAGLTCPKCGMKL